jgi:acetyl esterase/lipase
MRRTGIAVALACIAAAALGGTVSEDRVTSELNRQYGEAGGHKLLLDVFRAEVPADAKPKPALLMIHGGGWAGGSKDAYYNDARWFAARGFVCFSADYRLVAGTAGQWPQQLDDVQLAVRWVRANAAKYGADGSRVAAYGDSAGGHLVALLGTTDTRETSAPLASYSSRPECIIDVMGPVDMSDDFPTTGPFDINVQKLVDDMLGSRDNARAASPLHLIDRKTVPILIIHGVQDVLVPIDQSRRFAKALKEAGVEVELLELENSGHGFMGEDKEKLLETSLAFLRKHLGR